MEERSTDRLDPKSFFRASHAHWRLIVGAVVAIAALAFVTSMLTHYSSSRSVSVGVVFPQRTSASLPTLVHVSASRRTSDGELVRAKNATVTLWRTPATLNASVTRNITRALELGELVELDRGSTGEDGSISLEVPPTLSESMKEGAPEGAIIIPDGSALGLIVTVDYEGERDVRFTTVDPADGLASALTMDRPIYQPGQRALGRVLLVDSDSGAPASVPLQITARDPSSNVIFQKKLSSSDRGVASFEIPLSNPCPQGLYTIAIRSGNRTLTSRAFEVMPYRLPRFKVEVTPDPGSFGPDAPLTGAVVARYTTGDPVADATVLFTISSRFTDGSTGSETLRGATDADGAYRFSWDASSASPGSLLSLSAEVTSAAGRAERGQSMAPVAGLDASVQILALDHPDLSALSHNAAVLLVRDASGQPLSDTPVTIWAPESDGEKKFEGRTDARGRFVFSWSPASGNNNVSVEVRDPSGEQSVRRNLNVSANYQPNVLVDVPPTSPIDEPLTITVDNTSGGPLHLVLTRDGLVLGTQAVTQRGRAPFKLDLPARARGLLSIRAVNRQGYEIDRRQVWVTQSDAEAVDIETSKDVYTPGELAELSLTFPPSAGEPLPDDQTPVTFALVGVDEALYALRERPEEPLLVALGRAPRDVERALGVFTSATDELDARIARGAFERALGHAAPDWSNSSRDLSYELTQRSRSRRADLVALFLAALAVLAAAAASWHTWKTISISQFTKVRFAAHVGSGLAIIPFVITSLAVGRRGEAIIGAMIVYGAVIAGWLFGAAWRERDDNLTRWALYMGLAAVLILHSVIALEGTTYGARPTQDVTAFLMGSVGVFAALQVLVWPYRLWHRDHLAAGFGLASFFAVVLMLPVTFLLSSIGGSASPERLMKTASDGVSSARFDDYGGESSEEAPAPVLAKNSPAPSKPGATASAPRVRSYFPETMVWLPELTSNADGVATTSFEVPDSITTWRLDAWANTWDGRFAQGRSSIKVLKDFYAELDLPVDLTDGDDVYVPVSLVNRTDTLMEATLSASADGPLSVALATDPITVEPRGRVVTLLRVRADGVGDATLTVTATTAAGSADAVRRPTRVAPDGRRLRDAKTLPIGSGAKATIPVPRDTIRGSSLATLEVMPGAYADALESLDGMLSRPSGCFEQISSANYPNAIVLDELTRIGPDAWPGGAAAHTKAVDEAREFLALGYQKMLAHRRPDGGFALYTERNASEILITAYGLMILTDLAKHTHIDPNVTNSAASWLARLQKKDGSWPIYASRSVGGSWRDASDDIGQVRATAFVASALARHDAKRFKSALDRALARIEERAPFVESPNALAWAATAALDASKPELAGKLLGRITSNLSRGEDVAWVASNRPTWLGASSRWADIETTALTADALRRAGRGAEVLPDLIAYLDAARSPYGGWGSTQATVWALRALTGVSSQPDEDVTLNIALGGAPMPRASQSGKTGQLELASGDPRLYTFAATGDKGPNIFDIRSTGSTRANVRAAISYAVPWTSSAARVEGALLSVTHTSPTDLAFGATAKARVVVKNTLAAATGAVIVELPIPPGAWAPPAQFEDLVRRGLIDRFELTPTHARLYVSGLPASASRTYAYTFVPLLRGAMSLPPARAFLFYTPDPVAEVDAGDARVR